MSNGYSWTSAAPRISLKYYRWSRTRRRLIRRCFVSGYCTSTHLSPVLRKLACCISFVSAAVKPNRGFHYFSRTARRLSYNDRSVVTFLTFLSEIRRPAASPVLRRINFVSSIHLRLRTLEKETTTREKTGDSCSADHKQQSYRKLHG